MTIHPTPALLARYATGGDLDEASLWATEAHLEECAACRARLAGAVEPDTRQLLDEVASRVTAGIATGPGPAPRRRWRRTGFAVRTLPWLATAAGLMLAAVLLEATFAHLPSLVLLAAPVAPLLPVAAAWSRRTDPAWELMATAPRAGLPMLLRRTLAVLAAVGPVLAVAGWWTGHSPALWLLPCVAFTSAALALGGLIGVDRAALGLAITWAAVVVAPSLARQRLPAILDSSSWPGWAALTAALLGLLVVLTNNHHRLRVHHT